MQPFIPALFAPAARLFARAPCKRPTNNAIGQLLGNCKSTTLGGTFVASGVLTPGGDASFGASGGTTSGAVFKGSFTADTAGGSWVQTSEGRSGTWTAVKL